LCDEGTSDDTVDINPLLFRLHSHDYSHTFFHPEKKVLTASIHSNGLKYSSREEVSLRLATLKEAPSSLTSEEDQEAVEKHITSRKNKSKEPSKFISLTSNVLYVFWAWKRRMSSGCPDGFIIIVLESSELRASGRAKPGTEWLLEEKDKSAYKFAKLHEEVIVANYIQSEAILGSLPMSGLESSIPPWCRKILEHGAGVLGSEKKLTFQESLQTLPDRVDKVDSTRARESLRFALALLAPMLVPGKQRRGNIGSVVGRTNEHSRAEGMRPKVDPCPGHETISGQSVAEDGYVLIQSLPQKPITSVSTMKRDSRFAQEAEPFPRD
jgi:hypothetical protein